MLNEFAWSKDEESGKESLDCHIGINDEGQYEIRSHDGSQTEKFNTPEELGEAVTATLKERANR